MENNGRVMNLFPWRLRLHKVTSMTKDSPPSKMCDDGVGSQRGFVSLPGDRSEC
jgi:hypothetical protein